MAGWESADGRLGKAAEWYAGQDWAIFPCWGIVGGRCACGQLHPAPKDIGKHPLGSLAPEGMLDATSDTDCVRDWWSAQPEANIAVACAASGFIVVDIDPRNGGLDSWPKIVELIEKEGGSLPDTVEAVTGEYSVGGRVHKGRHLYFRVQPGEALKAGVEGHRGVDVKHKGYVMVAPSRHGSGCIYEWVPGAAPWEREIADAPEELLGLLRKRSRRSAGGGGGEDGAGLGLGVLEWDGARVDVDALIAAGIQEGERAITLYRIACAVANKFPVDTEMGRAAVRQIMRGVNAQHVHPPLDWEEELGHQVDRAIEFVRENPKSRMLEESLGPVMDWVSMQQETMGARLPSERARPVETVSSGPVMPGPEESGKADGAAIIAGGLDLPMLPPDADGPLREPMFPGEEAGLLQRTFTDVGNGRRFADYWGRQTKYTVGLGWRCWDGQYWEPDEGLIHVRERAKDLFSITVREATLYPDPEKQQEIVKFAMACKSTARINSAIANAESDPRVVVPLEKWDGNDYLLGVRNGVVDLRTGELVSGDPTQFITRRASVGYTPGLRNVRFEQFLDFATDGDKEFQEWLQKAAGLTLSGRREQDVLFLVYGLPGTGKNTLVEALFLLLSSYAQKLDADLLMARRAPSQQDMYQYAKLLGGRMIWIDELPEAERMKDDKVKALTGSETIEGRKPGENPITFRAQGKLWISTNHRPPIRDEAMWRRIRPIPFNQVPERPDPSLKPYIFDPAGGLPAVLSWAVDGAVKYFGSSSTDGLGWCKKVWDAAEVYRQHEDTVGQFLEEETRKKDGANVSMQHLYGIYRGWSEERGEKPMTIRRLAEKVSERPGETVTGLGKYALVEGRQLVMRVAETPGVSDWETALGFAR